MGGKGSGGRNRKPTAVKKLQGNPGKRRLNRKEPKPGPGIPVMPEFLNAVAIREWQHIVPILDKMGVLTTADGEALAGFCTSYAQLVKAEAAIEKYGIVIASLHKETGTAVLRMNPAVRIKSDALRQMRAFMQEFGLTPASRSKVAAVEGRDLVPDVKTQDALEDFVSRKPASEIPQ